MPCELAGLRAILKARSLSLSDYNSRDAVSKRSHRESLPTFARGVSSHDHQRFANDLCAALLAHAVHTKPVATLERL
jgi:hypothetical protein